MPFSENYLRQLVGGAVMGDFGPFTLSSLDETERYLRQIVARLASLPALLVEADFSSYGSGFASYIEVRIARKDHSDTATAARGQHTTRTTNGLMLYLSRLTPYWFYGGSEWSKTYDNGRSVSGSASFLNSESQAAINPAVWHLEAASVRAILQAFHYRLLTPAELRQPAPVEVVVPTILADKPYQVFDCFFYWED